MVSELASEPLHLVHGEDDPAVRRVGLDLPGGGERGLELRADPYPGADLLGEDLVPGDALGGQCVQLGGRRAACYLSSSSRPSSKTKSGLAPCPGVSANEMASAKRSTPPGRWGVRAQPDPPPPVGVGGVQGDSETGVRSAAARHMVQESADHLIDPVGRDPGDQVGVGTEYARKGPQPGVAPGQGQSEGSDAPGHISIPSAWR